MHNFNFHSDLLQDLDKVDEPEYGQENMKRKLFQDEPLFHEEKSQVGTGLMMQNAVKT